MRVAPSGWYLETNPTKSKFNLEDIWLDRRLFRIGLSCSKLEVTLINLGRKRSFEASPIPSEMTDGDKDFYIEKAVKVLYKDESHKDVYIVVSDEEGNNPHLIVDEDGRIFRPFQVLGELLGAGKTLHD